MKKQFKLIPALGVEFTVVRKKSATKKNAKTHVDLSEIDAYATKKQFLEIAKSLPQSPGLLIVSNKKQEIMKVMVCGLSVRERFLSLKESEEYSKFLSMICENESKSVVVNYAREKRA